MPNYQVLAPIDHDQKRYVPGQFIQLTEDQARELVGVGAIHSQPYANAPATVTPLPEDFPSRAVLVAAGRDTVESLAGLGESQLQAIKGIGPAAATAILAAGAELVN